MNGRSLGWTVGQAMLWIVVGALATWLAVGDPAPPRPLDVQASERVAALLDQLDLDAQQEAQVLAALSEHQAQSRDLIEQFRVQFGDLSKQADERIQKLLRPEQRRRYDDLALGDR